MKILLALSLVALVGCATNQPTLHLAFNSAGTMVNSESFDLNRVKLEGQMWTHGERIDVMPFKIAHWPAGEELAPNWRMSSVDRITLYGHCNEGRLYLVFPNGGK